MLACDKTVSFARLNDNGEGYSLATVHGASWYAKTEISIQNKGIVAASPVRVRIPKDALPAGFMPACGDFAILGELSELEKQSDLDGFTHAKVIGVGDNLRGRLPHVAVVCE